MVKRKNLVSIFLTIALVLTLNGTSVYASAIGGNTSGMEETSIAPRVAQYVWVDTDVLNVRSGPGTDYSIVGQVHRDQRLWITFAQYDDYGVDWYKCNAIGGWVCSLYVRYEA